MQTPRESSLIEQERAVRSRIAAKQAVAHVEELVACGPRFVGSDGDRRATEWVRGRMEKLGLTIEERPFSTLGHRGDVAEMVLDAGGRSFKGIPPYFSPATPDGGVTGELVFVGSGEESDYADVDVRGKVAVFQEVGLGYGRFWMGTFAATAAQRGALALVVIHPMPWAYRMSMEAGNSDLGRRFCPDQIPVMCVSATDGALIMHAIGSGNMHARVTIETATPAVEGVNISGVLAGTDLAEERIVIHAHRDHGIEPGANDNGSGLGAMLEVAKALVPESPRRSVEFLCTTAEEGVTPGVAAYIQERQTAGTLKHVRASIDLDMIGVGGKLQLVELGLWPDSEPIPHSEWLMSLLEGVADELGYELGRMTASWGVAESGRFLQAGVPAAWFWKPDDPYYHSEHDTVDKLDGNALKVAADITATAVLRMASAPVLPV